MEWQTKISIAKNNYDITHNDRILFMGSCFAENIGQKFIRYGFSSFVNPFGILFNPVSIAKCLENALTNTPLNNNDVVFHNNLWHSFLHHGAFSRDSKESCIDACNESIFQAHEFLKKTDYLILTFGTSFVYLKKGVPVANCHKIPGKEFVKKLYEVEEIVLLYKSLINNLLAFNPGLKIIFTISPVRHWKDGYRENQLSKSVLHLAVNEIQKLYPSFQYFPSYEIVMDELRDYRFYAEDMLHPSPATVDYIWQKFSEAYFSSNTNTIIEDVKKYRILENHRPLNEYLSKEHFEKVKNYKFELLKKYPFLKLN